VLVEQEGNNKLVLEEEEEPATASGPLLASSLDEMGEWILNTNFVAS